MNSYKALIILTVIFDVCYCGREEDLRECESTLKTIGFEYESGYLNCIFGLSLSFLKYEDFEKHVINKIPTYYNEPKKQAYLKTLYRDHIQSKRKDIKLKTTKEFCDTEVIKVLQEFGSGCFNAIISYNVGDVNNWLTNPVTKFCDSNDYKKFLEKTEK